jgi:tetratricopeptide (TPR) repeat protein
MTVRRHIILTLFCLFSFLLTYSQSQCDLIKSYSLAACKRDTANALITLEKFRQLFPADSLVENVNLALAEIYYRNGELENAKQISIKIVSKKNTILLGSFNNCPFMYDSTECFRQIFFFSDFKELQYKACINLYAVYSIQRKYDSALYFLKLAETDFSCPPYLPSDCRKNILLKYSAVYENMNDFDNAINVLVPYILSEQITHRLLLLLKKYRNFDSIKKAYEHIEDSITIDYGVISENPKVKNEQDEYGRILRTISIEEYGRIAYWHFLGQKFAIAGANDYKSHRVNGERKKRKLQPVKSDKELIQEAKLWIQKNTIYKLIYE